MHHIEHGMAPREATVQAMKEVSAPVIGIALILSAVFVPVALRRRPDRADVPAVRASRSRSRCCSRPSARSRCRRRSRRCCSSPPARRGARSACSSGGFNQVFDTATKGYVGVARLLIRRAVLTILIVGVVVVGVGLLGQRAAGRLHPRRGPGHLRRQRAAPAGGLRSSARAPCSRKSRRSWRRSRASSPTRRSAATAPSPSTYQPNFGTHLRSPQAVGRAARRVAARARHHAPAAARAGRDPGGGRLSVQHPDHLRLRGVGGLQLPAAGPERHAQRGRARGPDARLPRRRRVRRPEFACALHRVRPHLSASQGRARPGEGADARRAGERGLPGHVGVDGRHLRERLQPLRASLPRVRPGRRRLPPQARRHRRRLRPQQDDQHDDPALDARHHRLGPGHGADDPLQPAAARSRSTACPRAAYSLRAGARGARGGLPADDAQGDGLRLLVPVLPGEDRAARHAHVRARDRVRLPPAGRDVRELAPAVGRAARLAAGGARRLLRRLARRATTTTSTCRSA